MSCSFPPEDYFMMFCFYLYVDGKDTLTKRERSEMVFNVFHFDKCTGAADVTVREEAKKCVRVFLLYARTAD